MTTKYYASRKHCKAIKLQDWQDAPDESYVEVDLPTYTHLSTIKRLTAEAEKISEDGPSVSGLHKISAIMTEIGEADEKYQAYVMAQDAKAHGYTKRYEKEVDGVNCTAFSKGMNNAENAETDEKYSAFMDSTIPVPVKQLLTILAFLYSAEDNVSDEMRGGLYRLVRSESQKQHVQVEAVGTSIAVSISG